MNNPNTKAVALSPAQDREYAEMVRIEYAIKEAISLAHQYVFEDTANDMTDVLSAHQTAMAAFLEDLGITEL